jgi:hypothetical protein
MIDNDGDNDDDDDDDDGHITSSPSALHAATGPLGRPRSTPVRERPGLSQPHHQDAVMGSSCASPNKTESDEKREENRKEPVVTKLIRTDESTDLSFVKASVGTRNIRDGAPAPAGNCRDSELNVAPGGNTRAANPSDSSTLLDKDPRTIEGTGTQTKTCGREPGPVPQPQEK